MRFKSASIIRKLVSGIKSFSVWAACLNARGIQRDFTNCFLVQYQSGFLNGPKKRKLEGINALSDRKKGSLIA